MTIFSWGLKTFSDRGSFLKQAPFRHHYKNQDQNIIQSLHEFLELITIPEPQFVPSNAECDAQV